MMNPNKGNSTLNTLFTMMDNAVSRIFTAMPVQVLTVDTDKRLLDVMPMVSMLDNEGQAVEHAQISNIPYARQQAGDYGIIIDPKVGDKGLVVFASRDISNVVANRSKHIPASMRKHSISDAVYIASLLNEDPRTWLQITDGKLEMAIAPAPKQSPTTFLSVEDQKVEVSLANGSTTLSVENQNVKISLSSGTNVNITGTGVSIVTSQVDVTAPMVNVTGNAMVTGNVTINGTAEIMADAIIGGISFKNHVHGNGNKGSDTTPPKS